MSDYSSNFPQQRPVFAFNADAGKLDSRVSFSRADTPPTYAAPSAVHYWSNEKHLSSENLVPYSNLSSGFSFGRTTLASTNNSAPDGGSDAASILETAVSGSHEVYDTFASVSGQQYSFVYYLKANGRTKVIFKPQATSVIANVTFDLTAVTSTVTSGSADSHSITAIGSTGWYKCAATITATATGTGYTQFNLVDGTGASTYTGEVSKGVFAWGASVSSTGQTVVNETSGSIHRSYSSTLKSVSNAGDPRFEYSPADGQSVGTAKGLLIEAQATNLVTRSEEFDSWSVANGSIQSNVAVAPDGTLSADTLTEAAEASPTTNSHYVLRNITPAVSTSYTFSVYLKSAGRNNALLYTSVGGVSVNSIFNLSNGTVTYTGGSVTNAISPAGNGWYRCSITWTTTSTAVGSVRVYTADSDTTSTYTGNGYGAIICWGAQVETGAASSYIKTTSSTVSRAADSCSVVDATLFSSGEHTVIWEGDTDKCGDDPNLDKRFFSLSDTTTSNRLTVDYNDGTQVRLRNWADSNNDVAITYNADVTSGTHKVAATLKTNEVQLVIDGTRRQVDTSCVVGTGIQRLGVNTAFSDAYQQYTMTGHCKRITYYNVALSQTEAEALTS